MGTSRNPCNPKISPDLSSRDENRIHITTGYDAEGNVAADATGGLTTHGTSASPTAGHAPIWPLRLVYCALGGIQRKALHGSQTS